MNTITTIISRLYFIIVGFVITALVITGLVGFINYGTQSAEFKSMFIASAILLVVSIIFHRLISWAFFKTSKDTL